MKRNISEECEELKES